jgi:hypothetical protein
MAIGDNIDEINEKIRKLREELGKTPDTPFKPEEIDKAKEALGGLETELKNINSELNYTFKSFQSIVNEMTKGRTATQNITSATKKLSSITAQLQDQRDNIIKLSSKELNKLGDISKVKFAELRREKEFLEKKGTLTNKEELFLDEINGILAKNVGLQVAFNRQLDSALIKQESIESSVGLTGALLKSITQVPGLEAIGKFLKVDAAVEAMEEYNKQLFEAVLNSERIQIGEGLGQIEKDIESTTLELAELEEDIQNFEGEIKSDDPLLEKRKQKALELNDLTKKRAKIEKGVAKDITGLVGKLATGIVGLNAIFSKFAKTLMDPLVIFTALGKGMVTINEQAVNFSKAVGTSYDESRELRIEFSKVARFSNDTFNNSTRLAKAFQQYADTVGVVGKIIPKNSEAFALLTERVGVAADSAARLQRFSEAFGKDLMKQSKMQAGIVSQVGSQFGVSIKQQRVLEKVGKASAYTLVQFRGSVGELTEAVAMAEALGTTLENVNKIAGNLLNFEQSITNELKAELLIGKNINLERARLAALNNNQKVLMEEINREMGDFNDFTSLNRIQQEAFAEALGMSVNDISDMLLMEQYRTMNQKEFVALNGEEALERAAMLTTQEKFNNAILKLQDLVVTLVEGPLGFFAGLMGSILESTAGTVGFFGVLIGSQIPKIIKGFKILRKLSIAEAIAKIFAGNAALGPVGLGIAAVGVGALMAAIGSFATGDDMYSGYGKRALYEEGELTLLNNRDTVVAGTNLFKPALANDMISMGDMPSPVEPIMQSETIKEIVVSSPPPVSREENNTLRELLSEFKRMGNNQTENFRIQSQQRSEQTQAIRENRPAVDIFGGGYGEA